MKKVNQTELALITGGDKCWTTLGLIAGAGAGFSASGVFLPLGITLLATAGALYAMGGCQ